jgi:2-polyprenyl-3-methyl-5-hydroxy-6-metoxy-1,4-benzoquinol methylase
MRITYRSKNNKEYWQKRWDDVEVDEKMENANVYPLKYAKIAIDDKKGRILEAGCGAGRILRYYHDLGYDITGIDFIESVISKLKTTDSSQMSISITFWLLVSITTWKKGLIRHSPKLQEFSFQVVCYVLLSGPTIFKL